MRAGDLDRRVQFQRAVMVDNGFGEVEVFSDHGAPVWAKKTDVSDGERLRAGELSAALTSRFLVRWSEFTADLTPRDQLVFAGANFAIFGIKEVGGRREGFEITARARVDLVAP